MSSYVPTDWVEGVTPLNEANLDKIEQELVLLDGRKVPSIAGQEGKWLTVEGGAMVWAPAPAGGGGGGLDWEGAYAGATPYVKGDVVTHLGVVYGAVNDSTGQTPPPANGIPATFLPTPLVTALPSSPFDGQEVIFVDSLTAPTYTWRLRYVAAKATNKWIFVGGADLSVEITTSEATASLTYVALTTAGPSIAVPVAGDYIVTLGAQAQNATGGSGHYMSYDIGGTAAVDADRIGATATPSAVNMANYFRTRRKSLTAVTLTAKYRCVTGGTATFADRFMSLRPVAVGG